MTTAAITTSCSGPANFPIFKATGFKMAFSFQSEQARAQRSDAYKRAHIDAARMPQIQDAKQHVVSRAQASFAIIIHYLLSLLSRHATSP